MEKVEGEVYCTVHGGIHRRTNDPYDYGYAETGETPECEEQDWRTLYWRPRVGDYEAAA